jgi:hypothetical protein
VFEWIVVVVEEVLLDVLVGGHHELMVVDVELAREW